MIIYCEKEEIKIYSDTKPCVGARTILPIMTEAEQKDIEKKPFINKKNIAFIVFYKGIEYVIFIPKNYTYDGATIPFGFRWILGGKGNPEFLIASCVHDKTCECKWLINHDRHLSSLIFKELLLACGCSKTKANIMYIAVDNFQKTIKGWKKC